MSFNFLFLVFLNILFILISKLPPISIVNLKCFVVVVFNLQLPQINEAPILHVIYNHRCINVLIANDAVAN